MTKLEQLNEIERKLRSVREWMRMRSTPGYLSERGIFSAAHSKCDVTLCYQAYAGAKNYHESSADGQFGNELTEVVCEQMDHLLVIIEAKLVQKKNEIRVARKQELEEELRQIEAIESTKPNEQTPL